MLSNIDSTFYRVSKTPKIIKIGQKWQSVKNGKRILGILFLKKYCLLKRFNEIISICCLLLLRNSNRYLTNHPVPIFYQHFIIGDLYLLYAYIPT